jgi:hypothetical protein
VALQNADDPEASFVAAVPGTYGFALTVSDGLDSAQAMVEITVEDQRVVLTYPVGGETLLTSQSTRIQWYSNGADSRKLKLYISLNAGKSWLTLASGIPSSEGSGNQHAWKVAKRFANRNALFKVCYGKLNKLPASCSSSRSSVFIALSEADMPKPPGPVKPKPSACQSFFCR